MIKGIGLDMIDLERVKQVVEKNPRFIERCFNKKKKLSNLKNTKVIAKSNF